MTDIKVKQFTLADLMPATSKLELIHPTQGPLGIHLHLVGPDSKAYREEGKRLMKQRLMSGVDPKDVTKVDVDQMEKDNARLASSCIVGWDDEFLGEVYSPERAYELMAMPELAWVREQVEAAVRDRARFFGGAQKPTKQSRKA